MFSVVTCLWCYDKYVCLCVCVSEHVYVLSCCRTSQPRRKRWQEIKEQDLSLNQGLIYVCPFGVCSFSHTSYHFSSGSFISHHLYVPVEFTPAHKKRTTHAWWDTGRNVCTTVHFRLVGLCSMLVSHWAQYNHTTQYRPRSASPKCSRYGTSMTSAGVMGNKGSWLGLIALVSESPRKSMGPKFKLGCWSSCSFCLCLASCDVLQQLLSLHIHIARSQTHAMLYVRTCVRALECVQCLLTVWLVVPKPSYRRMCIWQVHK